MISNRHSSIQNDADLRYKLLRSTRRILSLILPPDELDQLGCVVFAILKYEKELIIDFWRSYFILQVMMGQKL
jgi:hypothetical protein